MAERPSRLCLALIGSAESLALFRIALTWVLLRTPELHDAERWSDVPAALRVAPVGVGWALRALPISPALVHLASVVLTLSAVLGLIGLFTRPALIAVTLSLAYLLLVPQLGGMVLHDHHLLWFAALLAAGPAGDALSVDAALAAARGRLPPRPSLAHGLPVRAAWALVAMIFFFPGLWKLRASGLSWIWSDNLQNQILWKWRETGRAPWPRLDRHPLLCRLAALGAVGFELSFGVLLLSRRTRALAVALALAFHALTAALLGITFSTLWVCYAMFIDARPLGRRLGRLFAEEVAAVRRVLASFPRRPRDQPAPARRAGPAAVVGAVLLAGNLAFGARGIVNGYPFTCYPTFQRMAGREMPALVVERVHADGTTTEVPQGTSSRELGVARSVAGISGVPVTDGRLRAYYRFLAGHDAAVTVAAQGAVAVRFRRVTRSVAPEDADRPPLRSELLAELPP